MNTHYLYPGQLIVFKEETLITTLLGSCVAVALYDRQKKIGGLNHYLIDRLPDVNHATPRYGCFAIPELVRQLEELGSQRKDLIARVYGGANVAEIAIGGESVGERNIQYALDFLRENGIPIQEKDLGGNSARTIKFNTATGEVRITRPDDEMQS
ncbi:cheB, glutamate methylesterase [Bdellovibrio bacteriovorus W]|nr:cheB, glutamate methylesterase [Bdellovibrio bacteriovorus W]